MAYQTQESQTQPTPGELVEHLIQFDGPPEQFLQHLLAVQCHLGAARHGAILRAGAGGALEAVGVYPQVKSETPPVWLAQAVEIAPKVLRSARAMTAPLRAPDELYSLEPQNYLALLPIHGGSKVRGAAVFVVPNTGAAQLEQAVQRLELTISLLSLYEMRLTVQRRSSDLSRLKQACAVLSEINAQKRYKAAAMALCNQVATTWNAERVSLGLVKGRYVKLQAMSHTEQFTRKMDLVQAIESAMEECLDQDLEVMWPATDDSTTICRSAGELATRYGPSTVISLPLRCGAETLGVLVVERPADRPFEIEQIEAMRVACDLCTPRLVELEQTDRWFGAKLAAWVKSGLKTAVGPTHTWVKAAVLAVTIFLAYAFFMQGEYRVDAPFIVEAAQRQVVAAPYDGFLLSAMVRPGDKVVANDTVLAELDTSQLQLELGAALAKYSGYLKQAQLARSENKMAEVQEAEYLAQEVEARIDLLRWQIDQATIRANLSGTVIAGDLDKQLGSPVQAGQTLFEVAPLEDLRVELSVPEDKIADLAVGQSGELAAVSHPGHFLRFQIERIEPVAQVVEQRNVFKVRAVLIDDAQRAEARRWLAPGMEGVAKVDAGQQPHIRIWTRDLVNWLRMKLWF